MAKESRLKSFVRFYELGKVDKANEIYKNPEFKDEFDEAMSLVKKNDVNEEKKTSKKELKE